MKRIVPILYLCALLLGLVLAYFTWTEEPEKPGGEVTILECAKDALKKLVIKEENRTVAFTQKKSGWSGETSWWVESTRIPFSPAKAEGEEDKAAAAEGKKGKEEEKKPAEEGKQIVVEVFKGNTKLKETLENFCPWTGLRALGKVGEAKRKEFGLEDAKDSLSLDLSSGTRRFLLGGATFGTKDRYVEDEKNNRIFLVKGQSIKDLLYPKSRFMERSMRSFKRDDVLRLKLRAGAKEKELVRVVSGEGKEVGWADSRTPKAPKDLYKNWVRKLFNLRPIDYVIPKEEEAVSSGPFGCATPQGCETVASLTFYGEREEIGFLTVYKKQDEEGKPEFFACTENTEALVKVSKTQTENLLKDMEDVLSES